MADSLPGQETRNQAADVAGGVLQGRDFQGNTFHFSGAGAGLPGPRQLPRDVAYFTGRHSDVDRLDALLGDQTAGSQALIVSALAGTAGVGKTALAVHWAHRVRDRFPDGDLYVNLQGYGPGPPLVPGQVLEGFLRAMGVPPERIPREVESRAALYRTLLSSRRVLIILDNANTAEQVRPLLPDSPGSLVVVTSRSLLPGLVARDGARRVVLDMLSPGEAQTLMSKIVGEDRIVAEPDASARIAQFCGHLPLALRIMAEYAVTHPRRSLSELAQALSDENGRLDAMSTGEDELTTVRTVFSWSYRALPDELARQFRLLSLHPGSDMSVEAAAALNDTSPAAARRLMDKLTGHHLIAEPIEGRYRFHDLLRVYALECAAADERPETRKQAVDRVLLWYVHAAAAARIALLVDDPDTPFTLPSTLGAPPTPVPVFADHQQTLAWCDGELDNFEAVVRKARQDERHDVACWLPVAMHPYFQRRNPFGSWTATHTAGLEAARAVGDLRAEAELHRGLGGAYYYQGRYQEALAHQRLALDCYRSLGREGEMILVNLGGACANLGRYDEAFNYLQEALVTARRTGYRSAEGFALQNLGATYQRLESFKESAPYCRQAIEVFREIDDRFGLSIALSRLAYAHIRQKELPQAIEFLRQGLDNARDIGDRPGEAWFLETLGTALHQADDKNTAQEEWLGALALYERLMNDDAAARLRAQLSRPDQPPATPLPRL